MNRHTMLVLALFTLATAAVASTVTILGPPGGHIYYDGKDMGPVPLRLTKVPPGIHRVRVVTTRGERSFALEYPRGQNIDRTIDMNVELARRSSSAVDRLTYTPYPGTEFTDPDAYEDGGSYVPPTYNYGYGPGPYAPYGYYYDDPAYYRYPLAEYYSRRHHDRDRDRYRDHRGSYTPPSTTSTSPFTPPSSAFTTPGTSFTPTPVSPGLGFQSQATPSTPSVGVQAAPTPGVVVPTGVVSNPPPIARRKQLGEP